MKWLFWSVLIVVMMVAADYGGAAAATAPCALVDNYFRTMNLSADPADGTGAFLHSYILFFWLYY